MKTRIFLAYITLVLTISMANAQITTTSNVFITKFNGGVEPEYVTVGSIMPYKVTPYNWGTLAQYMNPSIYKWWLNGNAAGYNLLKSDGTTMLAALPPPNNVYYPDSLISIQWVKTGKYTVRVNEKSMPKTNISTCDRPGDFQTLDVVVADRPNIAWDGPIVHGGCGLDSTLQNIPVTVKGSKQIKVTYTLVFTPQAGSPVATPAQTVIFNTTKNDTISAGNIQINIPKGGFGTYEVAITGITDKIASKCGIVSQPTDYPSDKYTLVAMPSLETSPIEFVTELP